MSADSLSSGNFPKFCYTFAPLKTKSPTKEPRFEDALQQLETLVQEMESGDLPLEDILKKYEEGNRLAKLCASKLNAAERRIEVLMKEKDGSPGLEPLEEEDDEGENLLPVRPISKETHSKKEDLF